MIYEDIFREFELKGVCYLVVGGVAVNFYGYVRITMDLDIMGAVIFGSIAKGEYTSKSDIDLLVVAEKGPA